MANRDENRFGEVTSIGTTYTIVGAAVPAATMWNTHIHLLNRHTSTTIKVRVFIADTSWTTGEPTGGTLKTALAYDTSLAPGEMIQITGVIMKTTEKLVVRSDTASSLDVAFSGVAIT